MGLARDFWGFLKIRKKNLAVADHNHILSFKFIDRFYGNQRAGAVHLHAVLN